MNSGIQQSEERAEVYKSVYEDYKDTFKYRMETVREIHRRAIELIKLNLLASSGVVPVFNILREQPQTNTQSLNLYLYFAIAALLYAIWENINAHTPRAYRVGLASKLEDFYDLSREEYYIGMANTYNNICNKNEKVLKKRTAHF